MIKTSKLIVQFKSQDIEFHPIVINKGKITFIKGRNGSGKTTILKAISNLIAYKGTIECPYVTTYLSQEPLLFNMSVLDNILYPLRIRKIEPNIQVIEEYAALLNIYKLLPKSAKELSSGEKMKVSILRSIMFYPEFVFLDEPTTHLDMESIDELIKLIKTLKNQITFVIVSHNKMFMDSLIEEEITIGEKYV